MQVCREGCALVSMGIGRAGTLDWALSDFAAMPGGAAGGRASESLRQPAVVAARPFVAGFPV